MKQELYKCAVSLPCTACTLAFGATNSEGRGQLIGTAAAFFELRLALGNVAVSGWTLWSIFAVGDMQPPTNGAGAPIKDHSPGKTYGQQLSTKQNSRELCKRFVGASKRRPRMVRTVQLLCLPPSLP